MIHFGRLFLLLFSILIGSTSAAADYPQSTIRLIVPYSPGGGTDLMARLLSKEISLQLDIPVIVPCCQATCLVT